jgi:RES domain-containing protein
MPLHGQYVCPDCFEDEDICAFVRTRLESDECSYCGKTSEDGTSIAADVEDVIDFIEGKLSEEYEDPVEQVGWNSAEGGWLGVYVYDSTHELFMDGLGGFPCSNEDLIEDIGNHIGDTRAWCDRDPHILSPGQGLSSGWMEFCRLVKHRTRFMFFPASAHEDDYEPEAVAPGQILGKIGELIQSSTMVRTLPDGTRLYRARIHAHGATYTTVDQLAPPPENVPFTNRMNPAGIPMFYAALDRQTAVLEVKSNQPTAASIGEFELLHEVRVVDLTALPPARGIFADGTRYEKAAIGFLHQFVRDATLPIERDGREHIEYVPTQIVTEYFRHRFLYEYAPGQRSQVQGILYPSSRSEHGLNAVLFLDRFSCEGIHDDSGLPRKKFLRLRATETLDPIPEN